MGRFIVDIEANGLLDVATVIHVVGWYNIDTGISGEIRDYAKMGRFFTQKDLTIVGHNFILFDKPLIKKILDIDVQARVICTLALSWVLNPKRNEHGLESYGEDFGIPKPKIEAEEWLGPLEGETEDEFYDKMANRVREDCKINLKVFQGQLWQLQTLYNHNVDEIQRYINYIMYKMDCAAEQSEIKWKLDKDKCEENLIKFELEYERRKEVLAQLMPEKINYKTIKKPKVFTKKDGTISSLGEKWLAILEDIGLDPEYDEPLKIEKDRETGNPGSHQQLKDWLYSLGWKPVTFKYEKVSRGVTRKIPQLSLPRGGGLCPSVKLLYKKEPNLEELDMLYVIKHRTGLLKGFLRDVDDNSYIQAQISGFTNTLRFKHAVAVNLPKPTGTDDWRDGSFIRGCLIAPEGYVLCGSDMSSLEDRTKQHYMHYFDPDYVKAMNVPGFDPHLDLAEFGHKMTEGAMGVSKEDIEWFKVWDYDAEHTEQEIKRYEHIKHQRADFKTVNYGAVYGVGAPTMSRSTGMPIKQCDVLLKAYWLKNWSVKEIAKSCKTKTIGGQMWLFNPVSRFWYSLRALKDRFSTLNQGTGVFCFDSWVRNCREAGVKMCGQFHDEIVAPIVDTEEDKDTAKVILKESVQKVNETLQLNRDLDIDVQFGDSYAEIH